MVNDPRFNLFPGTYKATITKTTDIDLFYTLEECDEWVYQITRRDVTPLFWENAVTNGWFDFEIRP